MAMNNPYDWQARLGGMLGGIPGGIMGNPLFAQMGVGAGQAMGSIMGQGRGMPGAQVPPPAPPPGPPPMQLPPNGPAGGQRIGEAQTYRQPPSSATPGAMDPNPRVNAGMPGAGGGATLPGMEQGLINYRDLLNDPKQAVFQAMMDMGYNPMSTGILTRELQNRAGDVLGQILPSLAGSTNVPGDLPGLIRQQVQRALTGQGVFYGAGGGAGALDVLRQAEQATLGGTATQGQRFLAEMLASGGQAQGIIGNLLFGGANPALGRTLEQQVQFLPFIARRQAQDLGDPNRTFLQQYLGR